MMSFYYVHLLDYRQFDILEHVIEAVKLDELRHVVVLLVSLTLDLQAELLLDGVARLGLRNSRPRPLYLGSDMDNNP